MRCTAVDRPNLLIKIPATKAGLPAITPVLAEGISVNVTLIFSGDRYLPRSSTPYLDGLDAALVAGRDHFRRSTRWRSFFVPRGHRDRQAPRR